jgi:hypothetical protein
MNADEMKRRSRGISADMSPEAILRRLEIVDELRSLTLFLGKSEKIEDAKSDGQKESPLPTRREGA